MDPIVNPTPNLIQNLKEKLKKFKVKYLGITVIAVLLVIGSFGLGLKMGTNGQIPYCKTVVQPGTLDFSLFWDAYNTLQEKFIDPAKIDNQKVIYGAIAGMTKSLGDPYTDFFTPEQAKLFEQDLSGSFGGIGVQIGVKNDKLTIIAPLVGTPGDRAGLKAGDVVVKIGEVDSISMSNEEAVSLIRGPKGTNITLTIFREGWDNTKDFTITRDTIVIPSIKWSLKEDDVAYIQIFQFDENLNSDFREIAMEIIASPAKKIVLDLRNDPGGYLNVCKDIAGWFLPKDKIVTIEDFGKDKEKKNYLTDGNGALENYPLVILMDQGSASASEILAGTLRDNRGIKLIGEKSFGKGSVQEVVDFNDGSFLKITIAKWLTPKGESISEVGLTPDIEIKISEQDAKDGKDPQLDKALEIVKGLK